MEAKTGPAATKTESDDFDFALKIMICGNSGVGKSNISLRYIQNKFDEASDFTIGVEFDEKIVQIGEHRVKLQFWNSSGKKMYMSMAKTHFKEVVGVVLVYDVTDTRSFEDIPNWVREISKDADDECKYILLGNK